MKKFIMATLLLTSSAFAASTLGVQDGTCRGGGVLESSHALGPDIKFQSVRVFQRGVIRAQSTVKVLGFPVTVSADLVFVPIGANMFRVESLTEKLPNGARKPVGQAMCDLTNCRFNAFVSNGSLYLEETLVPTQNGFRIVDGFQKFYGVPNRYSGEFNCR